MQNWWDIASSITSIPYHLASMGAAGTILWVFFTESGKEKIFKPLISILSHVRELSLVYEIQEDIKNLEQLDPDKTKTEMKQTLAVTHGISGIIDSSTALKKHLYKKKPDLEKMLKANSIKKTEASYIVKYLKNELENYKNFALSNYLGGSENE